MKTTRYFEALKKRPDRAMIKLELMLLVCQTPTETEKQADGRIRKWAPISEAEHRYLRVVFLEDGETIHNALFDRRFKL